MQFLGNSEQVLIDEIELLGGIVVDIDINAAEFGVDGTAFLAGDSVFGEEFVETVVAVPVTHLRNGFEAFLVGSRFKADISVLAVNGHLLAFRESFIFEMFFPYSIQITSMFVLWVGEIARDEIHDARDFVGGYCGILRQVFEGVLSLCTEAAEQNRRANDDNPFFIIMKFKLLIMNL